MSTLLLFDIDGTLTKNSLSGRLSYAKAFKDRFGFDLDLATADLSGKTDLLIFGELLRSCSLDPKLANDPLLLESYYAHLTTLAPLHPGRLLPGVTELLSQLSQLVEYKLALGTGNLEAGARIKLAPHDLNRFFAVGGFGDDSSERAQIIAAGITKAKKLYQTEFTKIVVIGDTPRDIACAQANEVYSIAVTTGDHDRAELEAAGATVVLEDLSQPAAFIKTISALSRLP